MQITRSMWLSHLIADLGLRRVAGRDVQITELTDDSRRAMPGCLFIVRAGAAANGAPEAMADDSASRKYIADAVARGAIAVLAPQSLVMNGLVLPQGVTLLAAERVDQALACRLAERFFEYPSRRLGVIGVTGTNGKTTITFLTQHILRHAGVKAGIVGTVWIDIGGRDEDPAAGRIDAELTTPGAIDFVRHLATMVDNGCRAAVVEMSSHGLEQGRVDALTLRAGVFTNLTGDHLDYHKTMEAYANAKARLFELLPADAWAIVNSGDAASPRMVRDFAGGASRVLSCAIEGDAPCRATILEATARGTRARFDGPWGSVDVTIPLIGRHNIMNTLQAIAAASAVTDVSRILREALATLPGVPGRLERVTAESAFCLAPASQPLASESRESLRRPVVLVDYAHTHDALDNVLRAVRPITPDTGRLIVVFGCGGDRDATKRPKMAHVACALADRVIITSDNPRTEDPKRIIDDILAGVPCESTGEPTNKARRVTVEPDRAKAIRLAIESADADDVVILAGKGHEDYQIIGKEKHHFDDREHAAEALRAWRPRASPQIHVTVKAASNTASMIGR